MLAARDPVLSDHVGCECPPEHTVTKLGHCRSCPYHGYEFSELEVNRATTPRAFRRVFTCGTLCPLADGAQHDFEWATYSDDELTTGVCRCGLREIDHDMMVAP